MIKCYDIKQKSIKTYCLSETIAKDFFEKNIMLILKTLKKMKEQAASNYNENKLIDDYELDSIGRHIGLKLIQIDDVIEDIENSSDINILYEYLEDLAKIWWNVFLNNRFDKIKENKLILDQSIRSFERLLHIFLKISA